MSRKDSKGLFANVLAQIDHPTTAAPLKSTSPHLLKVAAGVRQIQERGEALEKILRDGEHILEVDPSDVAPSAISDRFPGAYETAAIQQMIVSMRERGQIVPGLVRPTHGQSKPYQIVFGRRRLAAAAALGLKFKAIVQELTDEQAIVFQGEENTNRSDLSFIEKCAFALSLEQAGFSRDVISSSLTTQKSHVSEMIAIANALPEEVLFLIGPARDVGRRRWLELIDKWGNASDPHRCVEEALRAADSDGEVNRFAIALNILIQRAGRDTQATSNKTDVKAKGLLVATVKYSSAGAKMTFTKAVSQDFVRFVSERIETLHDEYMQGLSNSNEEAQ